MSGESHDDGETICVIPEPPRKAARVSAVRSTLVTSGLGTLRAKNLFERYLAALAPKHRETAMSTVAGVWIPVDFMLAHYAAYDALHLSHEEVRTMGRAIGDRLGESTLQALRRLATGAGVSPWIALPQYGRFWTRAFDGGAVRINKLGPKDATIAVSLVPFASSAYFRGTFCAIHEVGLGLFCTKMYTRVVPKTLVDDGFTIRMSWV